MQIVCEKFEVPADKRSKLLRPQCLFPNSTYEGFGLIAGSVVVEEWREARSWPVQEAAYYHFAVGERIPVEENAVVEKGGEAVYIHATYWNVSLFSSPRCLSTACFKFSPLATHPCF